MHFTSSITRREFQNVEEKMNFLGIYIERTQNNLKHIILTMVFGFTGISLYLGIVQIRIER